MTDTPELCDCADCVCPVHPRVGKCHNEGTSLLYRVDMEDLTGTLFCEPCADDAMESGVFTEDRPQTLDR